jgi:hypothetical protein
MIQILHLLTGRPDSIRTGRRQFSTAAKILRVLARATLHADTGGEIGGYAY